MPEWGIALVGTGSALAGVIITLIFHLIDNRQRFRVMTFEKRLKTHQEAISLCYELRRVLSIVDEKEKYIEIRKIETWWESNCLSLDKRSRHLVFTMVGDAYDHVGGFAEKRSQVWDSIN